MKRVQESGFVSVLRIPKYAEEELTAIIPLEELVAVSPLEELDSVSFELLLVVVCELEEMITTALEELEIRAASNIGAQSSALLARPNL